MHPSTKGVVSSLKSLIYRNAQQHMYRLQVICVHMYRLQVICAHMYRLQVICVHMYRLQVICAHMNVSGFLIFHFCF